MSASVFNEDSCYESVTYNKLKYFDALFSSNVSTNIPVKVPFVVPQRGFIKAIKAFISFLKYLKEERKSEFMIVFATCLGARW